MSGVVTVRGPRWLCACELVADPPDIDCVWEEDNGTRWQVLAVAGVVYTVGWDMKTEGAFAPPAF